MNLRLEKFSSLVQKQLAIILLEYQQPGTSISVNSIKISPDLKIAHVYLGVFGEAKESVFNTVKHYRGDISRQLATKIEAKSSPSLSFYLDEGQADSDRISKLLET